MQRALKNKEQKLYRLPMNICLTRNCHISFPKQTKLNHQHCFKNIKGHKLNTAKLNCKARCVHSNFINSRGDLSSK